MNHATGYPIHHSNLVPGERYILSHKVLGQAVVIFEGDDRFAVEEGVLQSRALNKKFGKGDVYELPGTMWDLVNFYEPV